MIYINKIENRIEFNTKIGYYLELLTAETMKLLRSTTRKITNDENGENVPNLEIAKVAWLQCNKIQESFIHLVSINRLVNY